MNSTLNNLALISFKRKARKLGKNIEVANLTDQGFFEEYLARAGETLIIWSEENGFEVSDENCEMYDVTHYILTKDLDKMIH